MDVYGLTGGIGSGKTTVADLLEEYGVPVVSADELSRIVVARGSEGLADVVRAFGPEVLDEHGELDRRKMAAIVFQDASKRRQLEAILHPRIRERFEQVLDALEKAGHEVAVYEVPLLFEKNLQGEMQAVILVTADQATRTRRVQARDDVTETEVRARMAAQMDEALKRKRADYIIDNSGTMDDLRREVEFLLDRFLRVGARKAAADMTEQSARPNEEAEQEEAAPPSRMRTEIPSGAGLPVDGQPPMLGQWSQPRTVTAPSPPVPAGPPVPPGPATEDAFAAAPAPQPSPEIPAEPPRRHKTMPAIPVAQLDAVPPPPGPVATPYPPVEATPGLPPRTGTPTAPSPTPPMPAAAAEPVAAPPTPAPPIASTMRTEGVATEPATNMESPTTSSSSDAAATSHDEDDEPSTARAGNPNATAEHDGGAPTGARRRKTMPASHFVDLRAGPRSGPTGPNATVPAPPNPIGPTAPNVPPPPTPPSENAAPSPPPPPPPIKRDS